MILKLVGDIRIFQHFLKLNFITYLLPPFLLGEESQ